MTGRPVARDPVRQIGEGLVDAAVRVTLDEGLAGGELQPAVEINIAHGDRAVEAARIEPQRAIGDVRFTPQAGKDLLGIGHLRHRLGVHEGPHFDLLNPSLGDGGKQL